MNEEKSKMLKLTTDQIETKFGKGSIMKFGEGGHDLNIGVIPTGALPLDAALGIGGVPRGRIVEVYGPESSGKTTLALQIIAEAQAMGGIVAFIDAEHALDPVYAARLGVDIDEVLISQPDTGEQALEKKAAEKAARKLPELSEDAQHSLTVLRRAKEYLDAKPELSAELSAAQRRKRAQLQSKPVYRYVALAIFVLGVAAAAPAHGLYSVFSHTGSYGVYFALFGFAAIFLFSSYNMLPTAHNNNNAIMKRAEKAEAAMAEYVKHYPHGAFPVKSWYAHPIVLKQMMDAVEEGRAVTVPEALDAVKARLKSLNADVEVEQEEYDEVVVIKALFLNHDYQ